MRLSTFNAENLFSRPHVMNLDTWSQGAPILTDVAKLNDLLALDDYTPVKAEIEALLNKYQLGDSSVLPKDRKFTVNETRDKLFKTPKGTTQAALVATGRSAWVGWVELTCDDISGPAITYTGRVVTEVNADVQLLVEVEDRLTLERFNEQVLSAQPYPPRYKYSMLIDGNDPRGIDIGLLCRDPYSLVSVRSHIAEPYADQSHRLFSRDCPEYEITGLTIDGKPEEKPLVIIGNHLKSKGYGDAGTSDKKRLAQATRAAEVYTAATKRSPYVAVMGDFNDCPGSTALAPLLKDTDLKDVMSDPALYADYGSYPGTYGSGKTDTQKIDFVLLSPELWKRVKAAGVERRGVWAPNTFKSFDGMTKETAASDHAAVWVDLRI